MFYYIVLLIFIVVDDDDLGQSKNFHGIDEAIVLRLYFGKVPQMSFLCCCFNNSTDVDGRKQMTMSNVDGFKHKATITGFVCPSTREV